jgi:transcription elongation GreA/GreB family factor
MSEKLDKFERLAQKRMVEAIKKIRLLGNLSNRNNYDYNEVHVESIISNLEKELADLRRKFVEESREKKEITFTFNATKNKN